MDALVYGALVTSLPDNAMVLQRAGGLATGGGAGVYRTELSVTGAGYVHAIFTYNNSNRQSTTVRVTIDGLAPTILDSTVTVTLPAINGDQFVKGYVLGLRFTTSLLVEAQGGTNTVGTNIIYSLDA